MTRSSGQEDEEILVLLPGASRTDALEIAERLREQGRERRPVGITVTVSIGIAVTEAGPSTPTI